jgi:hypothetical protein
MFPDNQQQQPGMSATLPPVPMQPQQLPQPGQPQAQTATAPPMQNEAAQVADAEQTASELKLLIKQYGNNPYVFSGAFQQLKAKYLLRKYHIQPNPDKN